MEIHIESRSFDVLTSRMLTPEEAENVLIEIESDEPIPEKDITLAELTNTMRNHKQKPRRSIGFC